jgi:hypothetical protein
VGLLSFTENVITPSANNYSRILGVFASRNKGNGVFISKGTAAAAADLQEECRSWSSGSEKEEEEEEEEKRCISTGAF